MNEVHHYFCTVEQPNWQAHRFSVPTFYNLAGGVFPTVPQRGTLLPFGEGYFDNTPYEEDTYTYLKVSMRTRGSGESYTHLNVWPESPTWFFSFGWYSVFFTRKEAIDMRLSAIPTFGLWTVRGTPQTNFLQIVAEGTSTTQHIARHMFANGTKLDFHIRSRCCELLRRMCSCNPTLRTREILLLLSSPDSQHTFVPICTKLFYGLKGYTDDAYVYQRNVDKVARDMEERKPAQFLAAKVGGRYQRFIDEEVTKPGLPLSFLGSIECRNALLPVHPKQPSDKNAKTTMRNDYYLVKKIDPKKIYNCSVTQIQKKFLGYFSQV